MPSTFQPFSDRSPIDDTIPHINILSSPLDQQHCQYSSSPVASSLKSHYRTFFSYLSASSLASSLCTSRTAPKLRLLLLGQLFELSTDLYEEALDRIDRDSCRTAHLDSRRKGVLSGAKSEDRAARRESLAGPAVGTRGETDMLCVKGRVNGRGEQRTMARRKLKGLEERKFTRLMADVCGDLERRFPDFGKGMTRREHA